MIRGFIGRADLVEALRRGDESLLAATAELLDFETRIRFVDEPREPVDGIKGDRNDPDEQVTVSAANWTQFRPVKVAYWRLVYHAEVGPASDGKSNEPTTRRPNDKAWRDCPKIVPVAQPLATEREIRTQLRKASSRTATGRSPDITLLIDRICRGELVDRIPLEKIRSWSASLHVIQDRAGRLTPYWTDQDFVCRVLRKLYPDYSLTISRIWDDSSTPQVLWPKSRRGMWSPPPAATEILVLSDLGCLAGDPDLRSELQRQWQEWGQQFEQVGNRTTALIPFRREEIPSALAAYWNPVAWEVAPYQPGTPDALDLLMAFVSPAVRLEPGLLREIRRLMPGGHGNPGLEARVFEHDAVRSQNSVAASFDAAFLPRLRAAFEQCDPELKEAVLNLIRDWRSKLHEAIWFEEVLGLDSETRKWFAKDVEDAVKFFREYGSKIGRGNAGFVNWDDVVIWARGFLDRVPNVLWRDEQLGEALHAMQQAVKPEGPAEVSAGMQPRFMPSSASNEIGLEIRHEGREFILTPAASDSQAQRGSWMGSIRTKNRELKVSFEEPEQMLVGRDFEAGDSFWLAGRPPAWAHKWDRDDHGLWCSFLIGTVEQIMRWVPAGSSSMGSPEDEEGRLPDEMPQRWVTIPEGFWIFETPCTQALWDAVMDENRCSFKGPNRPVENVSWHDCQEFIDRLNKQVPGLELHLPTETQWEFACRAGNPAPRYGETSDIAWFSENSDRTTHDVKLKTPNALGLHDMLGNVSEWCLNPSRRTNRSTRGGSWAHSAQNMRAAGRSELRSADRYGNLGFRCLSSSEASQPRGAVVSGSASQRGGARETATSEPPRSEKKSPTPRKARQFTWRDETPELRIDIPATAWLNIESDQETVAFRRDAAPDWAVRSGRDAFGLWAEFEYRRVCQRLRWIPPGRFLMGSAAEPEHFWLKETPQHTVTIQQGFWMFDSPCTQELYTAVKEKHESSFRGPQRPVEKVTWHDCQEFIERLNQEKRGLNLSLPSEAEWEYCCRAGSGAERYGEIDAIAWYDSNSNRETHDVKQLAPNAWGLFDMLGNVWEWCLDEPRDYSVPLPAERVLSAAAARVLRGGSWNSPTQSVQAAYRYAVQPEARFVTLGFRCLSYSEPSQYRATEA